MPSPTVLVSNLLQDTIQFQPVTNPVASNKDGKPPETFTLELGSKDDEDEMGRRMDALQPTVETPDWAVTELRKTTYFQHLERTNHIKVSRAA